MTNKIASPSTQFATPTSKSSQLIYWFTRPHPSITDIEKQRQSNLLATMIIVTFIVGLSLILVLLAIFPEQINTPDVRAMIIGVVLLPIPYLLNRMGLYEWASTLFILTLYVVFVAPSFSLGSGATSLAFAALAILMAGIFFNRRTFLLSVTVAIAYTAVQIVTNIDNPNSEVSTTNVQYFAVMFFLIILSALVSTFVVHVRVVENLRRRDLENANAALRKSEALLEQRVIERTRELETARHEAEAARQAAEQANQIKSQFLANMSHELRTPLNSVLNFTAFVADGIMGPVNEEQVDALQQSISSGKHLLALINDVLDITKIEAGLMDMFIQEVDLDEAIAVVLSMAKGLVKDKPVVLETQIDEKLPVTYGDKRRLRQVFLNIISNAIKFTREGQVSIKALNQGNQIRLEVKDTGIGIAPEDQSLVFESFKQAKHDLLDTPGTGLGMPLSKFFVEMHGGRIWFNSEIGKGTTFYVELPVLTETEANQLSEKNRSKIPHVELNA